ncbi:MAG: UDP-3-O-(3-hydroxymyristoyl)glucosamine N-acyltransferase [Phyllobacterium sp.]
MADQIFFTPSRYLTLGEIAEYVGASLDRSDSAAVQIGRLTSLDESTPDALVFVEGKKTTAELAGVQAAAVLCRQDIVKNLPAGVAALVSKHPQRDFAAVGRLLFPDSIRPKPWTGHTGVSNRATIHDTARIEAGASIEAGAVIGPDVEIGAGTLISANVVIGPGCQIGRDVYIGPGVSVQHSYIGNRVSIHPGVRLGQDGFGYVMGDRGLEKMPQLGRVIIQDDVELGANSTIDRGALADTVIGEGTKIDNMCQIGHNVRIGRHCVLAAHCGLSGSVTIGDMTMLGGFVGIADHVTVGQRVQIAAMSGVMNDIPDGERWGGSPAQPVKQWFRQVAAVRILGRPTKGRTGDE